LPDFIASRLTLDADPESLALGHNIVFLVIARSIASSLFRPVTVKGMRSARRFRMYTPQRGWITSRGFHMGNDERRDFPRIPVPKSDAREPALI
jgi:hypothetical protein